MSKDKFKLNSIESAIKDIRDGKIVIVVDDKNRENEGDFLVAAELITPTIINFMATHGRGLICAPITENIAKKLKLNLMVGTNTDPQDTAFTVSVDLSGNGVTTGISATDRAKTIKALIDSNATPENFSKPGHECIHNVNTWKMHQWIGLGPSASSQFGGIRYSNVPDLDKWICGLKEGARDRMEVQELTAS